MALVAPKQAVLPAFVAVPMPIGPMPLREGGPDGPQAAAGAPWMAWRGAGGVAGVFEPLVEALQVRLCLLLRPHETAREECPSRAVGGCAPLQGLSAAAAAMVAAVVTAVPAVAGAAAVVAVVVVAVAGAAFVFARAAFTVARAAIPAAILACAVARVALAFLALAFRFVAVVVAGCAQSLGAEAEAEHGGSRERRQFLHVFHLFRVWVKHVVPGASVPKLAGEAREGRGMEVRSFSFPPFPGFVGKGKECPPKAGWW